MKKINVVKLFLSAILSFVCVNAISAQVDSGMLRYLMLNWSAQSGDPLPDLYTTDMSGDGRFVVLESNADIATHNPRNADRNREIFLLDVAQRHIFQLTDTKHALQNPNNPPTQNSNILVGIFNTRPSISNDGHWIAFSSNATTSTPTNPNSTNPSNFDGNSPGTLQVLQQDGNMELWLYQLPTFPAVDLSTGDTPPFVDLGTGSFTRVTNSPASQLPSAGTSQWAPVVADDNHDPSINDDGNVVAFGSTRDLIPGQNAPPLNDNDEIFTYVVGSGVAQVTRTPRGHIGNPIYSNGSSISGDGRRVLFASTGTNPVIGMTGGNNPEFNTEVYFSELNSFGEPSGIKRQITSTTYPNFVPVNLVSPVSRNISRDGRYMAFVSSARLDAGSTPGQGYALFVYDSNDASFKRLGPYDNADSQLPQGDGLRYPRFSDYDATGNPSTIIFTSRLNFCPDGSLPPAGCTVGLNPSSSRPSQVFSYDLSNSNPSFKRMTNSALINPIEAGICASGNSSARMACGFVSGFASGQSWFLTADYLLTPPIIQEDTGVQGVTFFTGASGLSINSTPPQAQGLMPNMLGSMVYISQLAPSTIGFATAVSKSRSFVAPLQLRGVSLTIDGMSANIRSVTNGGVNFIVPAGLTAGIKPVVINNNGILIRGNLQIIQTPQPDILRSDFATNVPSANGRAHVLNITNPANPLPEPFKVTTQTPSGPAPTKLRLFLTGVEGVSASSVSIRIGPITIPGGSILTNAVAADYPGVFTFDFEMPQQLDGAGDVPVVVTVNGVQSRSDASASRIRILSTQPVPADIAVWRPSTGLWYVMGGPGSQQTTVTWGTATDKPVPGDYDGDGKTDFSVYRPSSGEWFVLNSSDATYNTYTWGGQVGDLAANADYDGDGKTDIAIYRPSNGYWYILRSSYGQAVEYFWGSGADLPVVADYDGDGRADISVWRSSTGEWSVLQSSNGASVQYTWGASNDTPIPADYDGDGKADTAVFRSSNSTWYLNCSTAGSVTYTWGQSGDMPVHNDYDADGKVDIGTWRPSNGQWNILRSSDGTLKQHTWGADGDIPVPAFYRR